MISEEVDRLSPELISELKEALACADLDLFIKLTESISPENDRLIQLLLTHAKNYEYEKLQQLLN
jgi:succinate dehydrogenase flavin-adding protein (antitoxin of CptAB toxin-antitoxin module)